MILSSTVSSLFQKVYNNYSSPFIIGLQDKIIFWPDILLLLEKVEAFLDGENTDWNMA